MVVIIAAVARNGAIGKDGSLPWHIPEDLLHFKQLTHGHAVLMGRATWESLPERFRPLPHRQNIVLTQNTSYPLPDGVQRAANLEDALKKYADEDLYIIGGAQVYRAAAPYADRLEITEVHQDVVDADTFFFNIDPSVFVEVAREPHDGYDFVSYSRRS